MTVNAAQILANNGATWSPVAKSPKQGFMVSLPGREVRVPVAEFSDVRLGQYMAEHKLTRGQFYGAWVDGDAVYLDVSLNVRSEELALYLGAKFEQLAVWDVEEEREVRVSDAPVPEFATLAVREVEPVRVSDALVSA